MLASLLSGCGPAGVGPGEIRLKREVVSTEVVGVWKLHPACVSSLANGKTLPLYSAPTNAVHEIEFRADGTCLFRSVIDYGGIRTGTEYLDCGGSWSLHRALDTRSCNYIHIGLARESGTYGYSLKFTELFGKLELWQFWGDPDSPFILRYEKVPNRSLQSGPLNTPILTGNSDFRVVPPKGHRH